MKTVITITACLLILAGCQDSEENRLFTVANAAKNSIAARYKDPDAVLFKDLKLDWHQQHICGELNAKNGFGAYTGYEMFRAELKGTGADTTVTDFWTARSKLNQVFDDSAAGRLTTTLGEARLKIIYEVVCDDSTSHQSSSKSPIYIPVKS